jgi:hypothetical protein
MALYEGDQQPTSYGVVNGVIAPLSAASVKAGQANGAASYRFTATYVVHYSAGSAASLGSLLTFRAGVSYQLDPALKSFLLALSAPMVAL